VLFCPLSAPYLIWVFRPLVVTVPMRAILYRAIKTDEQNFIGAKFKG
jgi:hypothetical protein